MKKKLLSVVLATMMAAVVVTGCGNQNSASDNSVNLADVDVSNATDEDKAKAKEVADMIDAIYVQSRTDETDAQCKAAKEGWDALTDVQKALVEGEEADPDYFGRNTGDASLDNSLNADEIGDKEILVVSFGTSFNDSRVNDIKGIEDAIQAANPDWSVRRAFTAQIIINHVQARDEEFIDNMDQALDRAVANNVKTLVVQPTHLMHGAEYDEMMDALSKYADKIDTIVVAEPLLGQVGNDATVVNDDKASVVNAVMNEAVKDSGYDSAEAAKADGVAYVFMGHGTSHTAKVSYSQMQTQFGTLGFDNAFVGTVEGEPEGTSCEEVIEAVKAAGYKKVILRPLMVVAGDHANNDMAGDEEDSWKSMFIADGSFDSVDCQISGLGRIAAVKDIYVAHTKTAIEASANGSVFDASKDDSSSEALADGTYKAKFDTDSSMFHVNEAYAGVGDLTVKDGKMTIHVTLAGTGISNLYVGLAADAEKDGAVLLQPTKDSVTYEDGTTEEVYGFDIPVPYLDKEFDCALIGSKEVWYDHKVSVSLVK